jgi:hypothetical protein
LGFGRHKRHLGLLLGSFLGWPLVIDGWTPWGLPNSIFFFEYFDLGFKIFDREKSEDIIEIKNSSKKGTLPFGILLEGKDGKLLYSFANQ